MMSKVALNHKIPRLPFLIITIIMIWEMIWLTQGDGGLRLISHNGWLCYKFTDKDYWLKQLKIKL